MGQAGGVTAIDLATGVAVWHNASVGGSASPALDGDTLYIHDTAGVVWALDARSGEQRWMHKTDESSTLGGVLVARIVTKNFVLVGGSGLEEVALPAGWPATFRGFAVAAPRRTTARSAWKKHTVEPPSNGATMWSTLSVDETSGVVVAATANNYTGEPSDTSDAFLALPSADGANFLWKQQIRQGNVFTSRESKGDLDADFGANPILFEVDGRKLAAGGNKGGDIWVLDESDGSIVKQRNFSSGSSFKGGVFNNGAWDGKSLLFAVNIATSTSRGSEPAQVDAATLFALDPLTLDVKWERQVKGPAYSPISVANGVGFFEEHHAPGLRHRDRRSVDGVHDRGHDLHGTRLVRRLRGFRQRDVVAPGERRHQVLRAQIALIWWRCPQNAAAAFRRGRPVVGEVETNAVSERFEGLSPLTWRDSTSESIAAS